MPPGIRGATNFSAGSGYATLYSFGAGNKADDGQRPLAALVAIGGELFGTTQYGGTTDYRCSLGCGTVFAVSTSGRERIVHRFTGVGDGAAPLGALLRNGGVLYGTTSAGGSAKRCSGGCGTVFEVRPDGKSEKVLYSFKGGSDGAGPAAGLVLLRGALYGTTAFGGAAAPLCYAGCGTVFRVSTTGSERVVYAFKGGKDGAGPMGRLIVNGGALYGTTQYGGVTTKLCGTGCGTVFALTPAGVKRTLHSFRYTTASSDGAFPAAGALAVGGVLYGTTAGGGTLGDGTVYSVNLTSGAERVIHSFACCASSRDGSYPLSALVQAGGALYGTTLQGGTRGKGVVFTITPSGAESVLHDFSGQPDGARPQAGVTVSGAMLYGTTSAGGSRSEGTVFTLPP